MSTLETESIDDVFARGNNIVEACSSSQHSSTATNMLISYMATSRGTGGGLEIVNANFEGYVNGWKPDNSLEYLPQYQVLQMIHKQQLNEPGLLTEAITAVCNKVECELKQKEVGTFLR